MMRGATFIALTLFLAGHVAVDATESETSANPIRKAVTMLQTIQARVHQEMEEREKIYHQKICDCKTAGVDMVHDIKVFEDKIPVIIANINGSKAKIDGLSFDINDAQSQYNKDESDIKNAKKKEEEEEARFMTEEDLLKQNIKTLFDAIQAMSEGVYGSQAAFLQSNTASRLEDLSVKLKMKPADRDLLTSFLSSDGSEGEHDPGSEEIIGILKQMYDEQMQDLKDLIGEDEALKWELQNLINAKQAEEDALKNEIEDASEQKGDEMVDLVGSENDKDEFDEKLSEAEIAYLNLKKRCMKTKTDYRNYYEECQKELKAIAEVIVMLGNDDALELFKKTVPRGGPMFLQLQATQKSKQQTALQALRSSHVKTHDPRVQMILLALKGKIPNFIKVIGEIDRLKDTMEREQDDDDYKKKQCDDDLAQAYKEKAAHEKSLNSKNAEIRKKKQDLKKLEDDIEALQEDNRNLDQREHTLTDQRKKDHEAFVQLVTENTKAIEVLKIAENRLNKYYNPTVYDEQTASTVEAAKAAVTDFAQSKSEPRRVIETTHTTVITYLNRLVDNLQKQNIEAREIEQQQKDDLASILEEDRKTKATNSKYITEKSGLKAQAGADLLVALEDKEEIEKEHANLMQELSALHGNCDFIVRFHSQRKQMRAAEIEGLERAKLVLSGGTTTTMAPTQANFIQTGMRLRHLRGRITAE